MKSLALGQSFGWSFAFACVLTLTSPSFAQTETQVSRPVDQNMDDADSLTTVNDEATISTTTTETPAATTQEGDININNTPATAAPVAAAPAASVSAKPPRSYPSLFRIIPAGGVASFTTANEVDLDNFDDGFSAGLFIDIGSATWVFETGILALNAETQTDSDTNSGTIDVDSWGIPLLAKINFSGQPHSTVFLKAGAMPFQPSGDSDDFEVLGVAGLGGAIPLFRNTALTLEATYNRILDDGGDLGSYQGVAALAGLQIGL